MTFAHQVVLPDSLSLINFDHNHDRHNTNIHPGPSTATPSTFTHRHALPLSSLLVRYICYELHRPMHIANRALRISRLTRPILTTRGAISEQTCRHLGRSRDTVPTAPRRLIIDRSSSALLSHCFLERCFRALCSRVDHRRVREAQGGTAGGRAQLRSPWNNEPAFHPAHLPGFSVY